MSAKFLAPVMGAAMALTLAACAGTGQFQSGYPAAGSASNNSPALGAGYTPNVLCDSVTHTHCVSAARDNGRVQRSNNSPALGAAYDPSISGCPVPGSVDCPYSNDADEILPGSRRDFGAQIPPIGNNPLAPEGVKSNNSPALGAEYDPRALACEQPGSADCPYTNDVDEILPDGLSAMTDDAKADGMGGEAPKYDDASPVTTYHAGIPTMVAGCHSDDYPMTSSPVSVVLLGNGEGHLYCRDEYIGEISVDFFTASVDALAFGHKPTSVLAATELAALDGPMDASSAPTAGNCTGPFCSDAAYQLPQHPEIDAGQFETIVDVPQLAIYRQLA